MKSSHAYVLSQALVALLFCTAFSAGTSPAAAQGPPCRPCAGIQVDDPTLAVRALETGARVESPQRLYVMWPGELDGSADPSADAWNAVRAAGGTPWMSVTFRAPAPVRENLDALEAELEVLAEIARQSGELAHILVDWQPSAGDVTADDLAYVTKRAAVAVTGGNADARFLLGPLVPDPDFLRELYGFELAAYVDGLVFPASANDDDVDAARALVAELDPGKPAVLGGLPWPEAPSQTLTESAAAEQRGFAVAFFDFAGTSEDLAPMKLLAREFQGDMSADPATIPSGAERAFTYVRGEDLSLRVLAEAPEGKVQMQLYFDDPFLRSPRLVDLQTGESGSVFGQSRTQSGLLVPVEEPARVSLLTLERVTAGELEGVEEEVQVDDTRQMPVEEILRRLQASEDDQARRLDHYQAINILHLRFPVAGTGGVEASFEGPFFYREEEGFDWVWETFYFNGVEWKGKKLPEIPIIQPEKAAVFPLEINFDKQYEYRLRGTEVVDGRDAWVIDFEPLESPPPGETSYQGTVWVDREIYVRVKSRTLQIGLEDEVLSNDETVFFEPLDASGMPTEWRRDAFFLPTRIRGQQVWSVLNAAVQVEREALLSEIRINATDFAEQVEEIYESDATILRDTQAGLRYLVKDDETGERVVKEGFDTKKVFLVGGVFYDESQDYPLPLAGINYLDLDFRGKGGQVNIFFAGAFLAANLAEPRLFGSKWDLGANVNGFFVGLGDETYRDGREVPEEEVERNNLSASIYIGRQIGNYTKLDFTLGANWTKYDRADDTAEDFILPQDTLTSRFQTELTYSRAGWRLRARGAQFQRQDWEFWGRPGNTDFDPEQEDYTRWDVSVSKVFWLKNFKKFGIEAEHLDGSDLDRFSKYDFGLFGEADVSGYPSGLVRAEEADGLHMSYGIDIGNVIQVELDADAVWATDTASGLDRELLAGLGFEGTTQGPWQTLINFEIGYALSGPGEDSVAARIAFLRLYN